MRVFVDIDKPWSTETYETCLIIDNRYIPVKHLSAMLETDTRILLNKWDPYISNKVEGCGVNRNFVQLEQLPNLLTAEGWDNDKIEKGLAYFTHSAPAPMRKRDLEEDGDEQYLKRGPTKRKEIQETIPKWAIDFMEECRKTVGNQAVEKYMETNEFAKQCEKAIMEKMEEIEDDLRKQLLPEVKKELKDQYRIEMRQKCEQEEKERSMQRFKLPVNQEFNNNLVSYAFANRNQNKSFDSLYSLSSSSFFSSASFFFGGRPRFFAGAAAASPLSFLAGFSFLTLVFFSLGSSAAAASLRSRFFFSLMRGIPFSFLNEFKRNMAVTYASSPLDFDILALRTLFLSVLSCSSILGKIIKPLIRKLIKKSPLCEIFLFYQQSPSQHVQKLWPIPQHCDKLTCDNFFNTLRQLS